ncbi:DUF2905 domain-containing protein [Porticoccus litoralis]|uniref:DUF2905 domain-containing protein n=1 Tax=Porticoccus litoralis TaxID=434086 RepID=A0AAW8B3G0_9GAMM|nr:DUF2905 domain-containing protein [Porticoccus litoralis]MDP1520284.1 DUF2905 domain-containing protein [Porticoccus litoralis]
MAKILMVLGAVLLALGTLWHFFPGALNWFGKLPGDINIKTEHSQVFIPITSMLIVSAVLSLLMYFFRR